MPNSLQLQRQSVVYFQTWIAALGEMVNLFFWNWCNQFSHKWSLSIVISKAKKLTLYVSKTKYISFRSKKMHVDFSQQTKIFLPKKIRLTIYNSLFRSHMEFGILAWGGISASKLDKVTKLQKSVSVMLPAKNITLILTQFFLYWVF